MELEKNEFFFLDDFVEEKRAKLYSEKSPLNLVKTSLGQKEKFNQLCENVKLSFDKEWEDKNGKTNESSDKLLETQRKAIIGYDQEVNYFKNKISDFLKMNGFQEDWYPSWYTDLVSAIFHENWGIAGISEWKQLKDSSSAKIIGERIYFLENGKAVLKEQTISPERLSQLKRALLLNTPEIRLKSQQYAEVYMIDGDRIMIYDESIVKQTTIVFRKDIINLYRFEEQAKRKTIDFESIPMQEAMVKIGYNVAFVGPVRTIKSTYLQTWQSYEDPTLEGIQIETDPEIPLHIRMPKAPIIQFVLDGEPLKQIMKPILRGDADYIIVAEARDGVALNIGTEAASRGTRRVKITFHITHPTDFVYLAADEIVKLFGGSINSTIVKVAKAYNYIFSFKQLKDKSQKRLTGIYEIRYDEDKYEVSIHQICKYDQFKEDWSYKYDIGEDKRQIGYEEDIEAFKVFDKELKRLSELKPMEGNNVTIPEYGRLGR